MKLLIGMMVSLQDDKEYVVVSKITYEGDDFVYLCELNNVENFKIAQVMNDNKLSIISAKEGILLNKIVPLMAVDAMNYLQKCNIA